MKKKLVRVRYVCHSVLKLNCRPENGQYDYLRSLIFLFSSDLQVALGWIEFSIAVHITCENAK